MQQVQDDEGQCGTVIKRGNPPAHDMGTMLQEDYADLVLQPKNSEKYNRMDVCSRSSYHLLLGTLRCNLLACHGPRAHPGYADIFQTTTHIHPNLAQPDTSKGPFTRKPRTPLHSSSLPLPLTSPPPTPDSVSPTPATSPSPSAAPLPTSHR